MPLTGSPGAHHTHVERQRAELRQCLEQAVALTEGSIITLNDLRLPGASAPASELPSVNLYCRIRPAISRY